MSESIYNKNASEIANFIKERVGSDMQITIRGFENLITAIDDVIADRVDKALTEAKTDVDKSTETRPKIEWVRCDERLPEQDGWYFVYSETEGFYGKRWFGYSSSQGSKFVSEKFGGRVWRKSPDSHIPYSRQNRFSKWAERPSVEVELPSGRVVKLVGL